MLPTLQLTEQIFNNFMIFFIQIYCSVVDPNTLNLDSDPDPELWPNSNPGFFLSINIKIKNYFKEEHISLKTVLLKTIRNLAQFGSRNILSIKKK